MPRFYFDVTDFGMSVADEEGVLVAQLEEAETEAAITLAEMLLERTTQTAAAHFEVLIRDETSAPVSRVKLTLERERLL
jgi:hypothetical protein